MRRPVDSPEGLVHQFIPGLRFERELMVRAPEGTRARWRRLGFRQVRGELAAVRMALTTAAALLGASATPVAQWRDQGGSHVDAAAMSNLVRSMAPSLEAIWLDGAGIIPTAPATPTVFLAGLQWLGTVRWPLVVGWEFESVDAQRHGRPSALLLLDALWPEPWGTGHNARLQLRHRTGASTSALTYRGLDGQIATVQLTGFFALRRPAPA